MKEKTIIKVLRFLAGRIVDIDHGVPLTVYELALLDEIRHGVFGSFEEDDDD